ncbi:MAG: hypothetical protein ACI88A_004230 [Paraglaciecola sp.]|jgi:hypothetical protein
MGNFTGSAPAGPLRHKTVGDFFASEATRKRCQLFCVRSSNLLGVFMPSPVVEG